MLDETYLAPSSSMDDWHSLEPQQTNSSSSSLTSEGIVTNFASNGHKILDEGKLEMRFANWEALMKATSIGTRKKDAPSGVYGTDDMMEMVRASGRIQGEWTEIGGHRFRLLVYPSGIQVIPKDELSVFVEIDAKAFPNEDAACCAQLAFCLGEPGSPGYTCRSLDFRFSRDEPECGFPSLSGHRQISGGGLKEKILRKDTSPMLGAEGSLRLTVQIRIVHDETGVLWHSFTHYNSKRVTGYVGLANQGATCYMNSLLQSLFHVGALRQAVYGIPTEKDEPTDSIPLALQRLFYKLQTSAHPVGTQELTRSFGWETIDAFMQHDVQEFSRVLLDALETRMKGTQVEGRMEQLFVGKMRNVIRCRDVPFESSREETYYDLQLPVKDVTTLEESFKLYLKPEVMEGSNAYHAEGFGLQAAERFVAFDSFPPILHCHLVRYTFDPETGDIAKYNGRLEFPTRLNTAQFSSKKTEEEDWYVLHSVLVHSGDSHGGHYFVYVRDFFKEDDKTSRWYKFDDTRVTPATEREAVDENFGGTALDGEVSGSMLGKRMLRRFTSAYMLVYVREKVLGEMLNGGTLEGVPSHIPERIKQDEELEEKRREERLAALQACQVMVFDDEAIQSHRGYDLFNLEDSEGKPRTGGRILNLRKDDTLDVLYEKVREEFGLKQEFRIWNFNPRKNQTTRIDTPLLRSSTKTLSSVSTQNRNLFFYVSEVKEEDLKPGLLLVWFKLVLPAEEPHPLFPSKLTMFPLLKLFVKDDALIDDFMPLLREAARPFLPNADAFTFQVFEELKPQRIEPRNILSSFKSNELRTGDILVIAPKEIKVLDYYDDLAALVAVDLADKSNPDRRLSNLQLSYKLTGHKIHAMIAEHVAKVPPESFRLWLADRMNDKLPGMATPLKPDVKLQDQVKRGITSFSANPSHLTLFFEDMNETDEEEELEVEFQGEKVLIKLAPSCGEMLPNDKSLLLEINNHQIRFLMNVECQFIKHAGCEYAVFEQAETPASKSFVPLFHYYRDPSMPHSKPILVQLEPEETFDELAKRLISSLKRAEESEGDFTLRLFLYGKALPIVGEEVLAKREDIQTQWKETWKRVMPSHVFLQLGLMHTPPPGTSSSTPKLTMPSTSSMSSAIRIKRP